MTTMVFHAPYPVEEGGTGSSARPPKMLNAFRSIGIEVLDITGHGAERARRVRALRQRIEQGQRIDFAYGESSTMPTVLTEPHHLPTHPFVDLELLRLLHRSGIPTGVFYRDVYWRFPAYDESVPRLIGYGTKTLYHLELRAMARWLDRLYVPSERMVPYIPHIDSSITRSLPPGGQLTDAALSGASAASDATTELTLFYVGNVSEYYRMHALVEAVGRVEGVRLILCTPPDAWDSVRHDYEPLLTESVQIVHARGSDLEQYFAAADLCCLVVEPAEYRNFAAPIKLYEYIGHGKPILASEGTLAAELVDKQGFGWSIPYSTDDIASRLTDLRNRRDEVESSTRSVKSGRTAHTWEARAQQVAADLMTVRR